MQAEEVRSLHLRGLLEQYAAVDCWCGYSFRDVVGEYVLRPTNPNDPEVAQYVDRERVRSLEVTAPMAAEQRRGGLSEDIDRLLQRTRDEGVRRQALLEAGGADVLDFTEFWIPTGDSCTSRFPTTLFLLLTKAYAQDTETQGGPFDLPRESAMLEAAERDAERLTDATN